MKPVFVKDRNIKGYILIVNESVEDYHKTKRRETIIKLDLKKAWLHKLGFLGFPDAPERFWK